MSKHAAAPTPGQANPAAETTQREVPPHSEISSRAFEIWHERGKPDGADLEIWFEAERQLLDGRSGKHVRSHTETAEQTREAQESVKASLTGPSPREKMIASGRGNQQSGRHSGREQS